MAAIVHNVVGLLHASMGIYQAFLDRVPVLVLGATGGTFKGCVNGEGGVPSS